jgi:hypothetical protein
MEPLLKTLPSSAFVTELKKIHEYCSGVHVIVRLVLSLAGFVPDCQDVILV